MITSCRITQAGHEGELAAGMTEWMRGDESPNAIAASRIVAETILLWRVILNSKITR
jgi:hypothetical protein